MRILVVINEDPAQRYVVKLNSDELTKKISWLVGRGRHSQAIVEALASGRVEKRIADSDVASTGASLILSENNAFWDITAKPIA